MKIKLIGPFILMLALVVSGCGGSSAANAGPYYNMGTLAKGIEESLTEKSPDLAAGTTVTCIQTGQQTAECHATDKDNGNETSIEVSISKNGKSFISH
jgi:hypothetical protein